MRAREGEGEGECESDTFNRNTPLDVGNPHLIGGPISSQVSDSVH